MLVKAQRVSKMKDNVTWCVPSDGYDKDNAVEIELDNYKEIDTVQGELQQSDEKWPKGAPIMDFFKVGHIIYQKQS
ncbi:MAG: hypothetical protein N0E58_04745 [Candidatus Thiodiazotropha endolucinida]|uniref:Uncharacterized protein n=1 Tax=Candidatus Thiodiazotropha taylori TaxID=2792791 RepID=A0A9E4NI93_9GAMM|nr:hypothetical protein [Candidatus Thiodiazotropha taylori]MCW4235558.1 hypothetical protein [Candidatus Thiodiazotropha endolucinida]